MIIKVILFYILIFLTNIFIKKKKTYLRSTTLVFSSKFSNISMLTIWWCISSIHPIVYFLYEAYTWKIIH